MQQVHPLAFITEQQGEEEESQHHSDREADDIV